MLKTPHKELSLFQKQMKILYINELLEKDEQFDARIRAAMKKALKKCPELSKSVTLSDMEQHEVLDINNPIE